MKNYSGWISMKFPVDVFNPQRMYVLTLSSSANIKPQIKYLFNNLIDKIVDCRGWKRLFVYNNYCNMCEIV